MTNGLRPVGITGIGVGIPERVMTNAEMGQIVDTSDEWIASRTGIRERRIAAPDEFTSTLGTRAARQAMAMAGVGPDDIDLIVVGTVTPDMMFPATACVIQRDLGALRAAAFDVAAACPGFIYALATGQQFVASGTAQCALIVGADTLTKIVDWTDRRTCVLFGDGAGAVVLQPVREGRGIVSTVLGSDGRGIPSLYVPAGGCAMPITPEVMEQRLQYVRMNGQEVFKFAVRVMVESIRQSLERADLSLNDLDLLIPHQANQRIIEAAVKRLEIPWEKVVVNVARYGNTSSASIPIALMEALEAGRVHDGDLINIVSFGAGLVWGAATLRWGR